MISGTESSSDSLNDRNRIAVPVIRYRLVVMKMICREIRLETEEKKRDRRDRLKALLIGSGAAAVIAAFVVLSGRLGIR